MSSMSPEDADRLRKSCLRARRAGKPFRFFYCVSSGDAKPVLLIDKRLMPAEIKDVRRTASVKKFLSGTVGSEDGRLVFRTKKPQKRFLRDLKTVFGQEVPFLRQAQVLGLEEASAEDAPPESDGLSDQEREAHAAAAAARKRLEAFQEKTARARAREGDARQKVLDLVARVQSAVPEFAELGTDAVQVAALADARRGELEAHFAELRRFLEGRVQRRARKEASSKAERTEIARRTEADAREQAYLALLDELLIAQQDIAAGAEALFLLDAEVAEARAEAELAAAEREASRAQTIRATAGLHDREDALAAALAASPVAAPLLAESAALEREADLLADDAMDLQMELSELEADRDALAASIAAAGPDASPEDIAWLADLEAELHTRDAELEDLIRQTDAVHEEVAARQADVEALTAGDPAVQQARAARDDAQAVVADWVAAEAGAERAQARAEGVTAEHSRKRAVAQILTEARAWMARTAPMLEVLEGIDPRDPDEARRSGTLLAQPGVLNALSDSQHYFRQLVRAGATDDELSALFAPVPAPWRPDGYDAHRAWSQSADRWSEAATRPVPEQLAQIETDLGALGGLPDATVPDAPDLLAARLQAFRGAEDPDAARLQDFQLALELKEAFRQAQDPSLTDEERQAATRTLLAASRAEPRSVIAWLARSGDAQAARLACAEGLREEELIRAAPAVALGAMLRLAREGERRGETFAQWLSGLERWTSDVLGRIGATVDGWRRAVSDWRAEVQAGTPQAPLSLEVLPAGMVEGLRHALDKLGDKHTSLKERPAGADTAAHLKALDAAREQLDRQLVDARRPLVGNLRLVSAVRAELDDDTASQLNGALQAHVGLLQHLAKTA